MVAHGDSRLIERCNLLDQQLDLICTIEKIGLGPEVEEKKSEAMARFFMERGRGSQTRWCGLDRVNVPSLR
jgi:hypothetical protein